MRIAQVSPLYESVPPKMYGGTERVVSYLTEALVAEGHEITLFASGDSLTQARLCSPCAKSLRLGYGYDQPLIPHFIMFEEIRRRQSEFDLIHFHTEYIHFPWARTLSVPTVTTLHGRQDLTHYESLFEEYRELPLISISHSQRTPIPWANWLTTIHHGLPQNLYDFSPRSEGYAVFLGRVSREKRLDRAIEITRAAGIPLKVAAKIDPNDHKYFNAEIRPLLENSDHVEFLGEVADHDKQDLLGGADVLVFPIDWPEPFGLVMIEAMACGTPVLAYRNGATPEIIDDGVTGFLVDSMSEAVERLRDIRYLDRRRCREVFEKRFSVDRMVKDYLQAYEHLLERRLVRPSPVARPLL